MSAWQIYRDTYPDLTASLRTEQDARRHFIQHGRNEGRLWVDNLPWTIANFAKIYAPCFAGQQGIETGGPSDVFAKAATQLGWDIRGHYLGYCVVARADGKAIDAGDQTARQVIDDLVEKYLLGTVIQARTTPPTGSAHPSSTKK